MRRDAQRTFRNIKGATPEYLDEFLAVFQRNYVKPQSMATAKRKVQKLVFKPANEKFANFLDELQQAGQRRFRDSRICQHRAILLGQNNATTQEKINR